MINDFGRGRSGDNNIVSGKILDFSKGKRLYLNSQVESVIFALLGYGVKYFDNLYENARAKFVSFSQGMDIDRSFHSLFEVWYVLNYRFHNDVSPIIEFYMVEYEELIDDTLFDIMENLKHSFLSIYEILWSNNHTLLLRDIFNETEIMTYNEFGSANQTPGTLMLARVTNIDYLSLVVGQPAYIHSDFKHYLYDEINAARIYEGEADFRKFLRDYAEVAVGLVMDANHGIKKNRVKYRCKAINENQPRLLVEKMVNNDLFSLLDRNEKWLKFNLNSGTGRFTRLYLGKDRVIVAAEVKDDLTFATGQLDLITEGDITNWLEGYKLEWQEDAEDLLIEIMHDKYIEEWLATPNIDLENMTPLLAMKDIRGRVLLENLLNDLELMELRAVSRGEYALPTTEIRTKLGLNKDRLDKDMLEPEAIAVKVNWSRTRQDLSTYITGYNWVNQESEQVAIYLFDLYNSGGWDSNRLAWLLYIWNEFSAVYRPRVTKVNIWAAALEHALPVNVGRSGGQSGPPFRFGISTAIISRNSGLITGHLKRFPLNYERKPIAYPSWTGLENREKVAIYKDVIQRLQIFEHTLRNSQFDHKVQATQEFYEGIDITGLYWDEPTGEAWQQFFNFYYLLSSKDQSHCTIANYFWENQAKRYPPSLKTAAYNLMMSCVGTYIIELIAPGTLIFKDFFTGCRYEVYGRIARNVHKSIVPGTVVITRLLVVGDRFWVDNPLYTLSVDMQMSFESNLQILMEQLPATDTSDPDYLKKRGFFILKAYIKTVADLERNAVNLLKKPLEIEWRIADKLDYHDACRLLALNPRFQLLYKDQSRSSYIWISAGSVQGYDWGYVLLEGSRLLLCSPPGKDESKFRKEIRRSFKVADIVVACRELTGSAGVLEDLSSKLVNDLSGFMSLYPQVMPLLFRPDDLPDKEEEWLQGVFLFKLGSIIKKNLENKH
ncbi:MAG TPA: hypothetical protein VHQ70_01075 [Syntrophomonadaceae bacterium]|nr:hypothetical protein [Syntrophomonadaceae bacterium]